MSLEIIFQTCVAFFAVSGSSNAAWLVGSSARSHIIGPVAPLTTDYALELQQVEFLLPGGRLSFLIVVTMNAIQALKLSVPVYEAHLGKRPMR
jgi:hypothetical protein